MKFKQEMLRTVGAAALALLAGLATAAEPGADELFAQGKAAKPFSTEAADLYRRAADLGHAEAAYEFGMAVKFGRGVRADEKDACNWFAKAGPFGSYSLASCFKKGLIGGAPDFRKAAEIFQQRADQGNLEYAFYAGELYEAGGPNLPADKAKAIAYFEKAKTGNMAKAAGAKLDELLGGDALRKFYLDATRVLRAMNFRQTRDDTQSTDYHADFEGAYQGNNFKFRMTFMKTGQKASGLGLSMAAVTDNDKLRDGALEQVFARLKSELGEARIQSVYVQFPQLNSSY